MASGDERADTIDLDGSDLAVGVIATRWNKDIVTRLVEGAERGLQSVGATKVEHVSVPGAYELPLASLALSKSGTVDAIVVLGAVIRGETTHYELVAGECGRAIMDVQLATGIPIGFGVLTVENHAQAIARSEPAGGHNVGEEAVLAAVELAVLSANYPAASELT